ncbi:MAG: hypothetical protein AVDCRST_MAG68-5416 [uncultured Gemmatimonadetes bacterium]|uniref:Uncharacterized protein n=1 Tax=uncultured Gemmatimonadota bacterium TaxID=203437 RepID=A0A6J4MVA0_9BACT|nr:MAG: hypothetical protein AVDCRST_MAG68-5416 [uncultured Gemmatimonadota bacterium]
MGVAESERLLGGSGSQSTTSRRCSLFPLQDLGSFPGVPRTKEKAQR